MQGAPLGSRVQAPTTLSLLDLLHHQLAGDLSFPVNPSDLKFNLNDLKFK
jgi:hypothetical protein